MSLRIDRIGALNASIHTGKKMEEFLPFIKTTKEYNEKNIDLNDFELTKEEQERLEKKKERIKRNKKKLSEEEIQNRHISIMLNSQDVVPVGQKLKRKKTKR